MDQSVELSSEGVASITAKSFQGLLEELIKEQVHWEELIQSFEGADYFGYTFRFEYGAAIAELERVLEHDDQDDPVVYDDIKNILPYRNSVIGEELLKQFVEGKLNEAKDLLFAYYLRSGWVDESRREYVVRDMSNYYKIDRLVKGTALLDALHTVETYAPVRVSAQKLTAEVKAVRQRKDDLDLEIEAIQEARETFLKFMLDTSEGYEKEARVRLKLYNRWTKQIDGTHDKQATKWEKAFQETHTKFVSQLQYKAPVELWTSRAKQHQEKALWGLARFILLLVAIVCAVSAGLYFGGDYVANSFVAERCSGEDPKICEQVFSPKGLFTTSCILLVTSLLLWVLRLQNKVYLSERHLYLDAEEKKAFAETYLALIESGSAAREHEAIVLATLFRPTQDGIVKDEDNGLDLSVVAMLSKQLSKSNP